MSEDLTGKFSEALMEGDAGDEAGQRPAAPGSRLGSLRDRLRQVRENLTVDLAVPRWEESGPPVFVRYAPLPQGTIIAANRRAEKSKATDRFVVASATLLAHSCRGVFAVVDNEEISLDENDPDGEWPRFDERLGQILGLDGVTDAVSVVRELFFTDGDITAAADKLIEWSGYAAEELDRQGN